MIKYNFQALLQKMLGYKQYLFLFSLYTSKRILKSAKEKHFRFFCDLIKGGGIILDIGANIGAVSVYLCKRFPDSRIYAFEPIPPAADTLEKVVAHHSLANLVLFRTALGDRNGKVTMHMPISYRSKMHGLSHISERTIGKKKEGINYTVTLQKLDDIIELQTADRVSAIKLDVENYEVFVLRGGIELLKKYRPPIFCEVWENQLGNECKQFLTDLGYQIHFFDGVKLVPYTGQSQLDLIFLPVK